MCKTNSNQSKKFGERKVIRDEGIGKQSGLSKNFLENLKVKQF